MKLPLEEVEELEIEELEELEREADPFAPGADPYPAEPRLSRREVATALLVAAPVATLLGGCVGPRRACVPRTEEPRSCEHRFCRYYRQ